MNGLEITDIKVWPLKNAKEGTNLRANVSVTYNDSVSVNGKLWNSRNGLFFGADGRWGDKINPETNKKPFYAAWVCKDEEMKNKVQQLVIDKFNQEVGNQPQSSGAVDNFAASKNPEDIPF